MKSFKIPVRRADIALFSGFLISALLVYPVTSSFPSPLLPGYPGSAMFPRLVLIAMAIIAAFGLLRSVLARRPVGDGAVLEIPLKAFAAIVIVLAAFSAVLAYAGMEYAVFGMVAGCLYFRNRSLLIAVGSGLVSVATVYLIFVQALSVHLPLAFLPRYLVGL